MALNLDQELGSKVVTLRSAYEIAIHSMELVLFWANWMKRHEFLTGSATDFLPTGPTSQMPFGIPHAPPELTSDDLLSGLATYANNGLAEALKPFEGLWQGDLFGLIERYPELAGLSPNPASRIIAELLDNALGQSKPRHWSRAKHQTRKRGK